ncbi:MAG: hypothetical protein ABJE95_37185 [Byssovorax sp.]
MKSTASILALAAFGLGPAACIIATAPQPFPDPGAGAAASSPAIPPPVETLPSVPPNPGTTRPDPDPAHRVCHLPAPKKSDDACKVDADCAPSDPCHAKACVDKAKARPRKPEIMCTMMMGCETADANRCGCFEGRCSLIPPDDAAKE